MESPTEPQTVEMKEIQEFSKDSSPERNRSRSPAMRSASPREERKPRQRNERNDRDQRDNRRGQNLPQRPGDVTMRILISSREAGNIIGKGGQNVKEIRLESGSSVVVSENIAGVHERIVQVSGELEQVAKGVSLIAYKINQEALLDEKRGPVTPEQIKAKPIALRLLIPHGRMGAIIGKAGAKIKEIQEKSGAHATATDTPLQGSTERLFTLNGLVDSIHIAIYWIGRVLQDADKERGGPPPGHIQYRPGTVMPMPGQGPSMGMGMGINAMPLGRTQTMTQQIFVPNDMIGSIIGKGGRSINEVRSMSGAQVKIEEPEEGKNERAVTISGSQQANQMALYLLYNRMEQERAKKVQT
jgi:heterogeneous nuclear rnp K-like protein 2